MIDIEVEDAAWTNALPAATSLALRAAGAVFQILPRDTSPAGAGQDLGVTILLTDDDAVRELNGRFRGQEKPTNVLSFPAPENPEGHLGDICLAYGTCAREAREQGKTLAAHLQHLVAHGVLHLLGYDHMSDDEALAMEGLERAVLASLGLPDPYAGEGDHD